MRDVKPPADAHHEVQYGASSNGKVEPRHRIDDEELWSRHRFDRLPDALDAVRAWERRYNCDRFSLALAGRTLAQKLSDHLMRVQEILAA